MLRVVLLALLLSTSTMSVALVHADEPRAGASACTSIDGAAARLACYDRAVGRETIAQQKTALTRPADVFSNDSVADVNRCDKGAPSSLLDSRWELDPDTAEDPKPAAFCIRPFRPIYLMPFFYTTRTNQSPSSPAPGNSVATPERIDHAELKYQISLKTKLANDLFGDNGDLWMGYTQVSHWQIFNENRSRPFRETNYEPEANLVFRTDFDVLGWKARMLGFGLVHQSNGRSDPLSRSWNRATAALGLERGNWTVVMRPWWRMFEIGEDNNPDISDYMGRGDLQIVKVADDSQFALMLRHSLRGGDRNHGAVQFDWAFPIAPPLRGHLQIFNGYGESMIDYNHRAWYAGIGVSLIEWY
ncbi:MAG: phospholipase A [Xanthomonadales bacterium]|nr:phospholipase A [Xanthomonadales bacterium]